MFERPSPRTSKKNGRGADMDAFFSALLVIAVLALLVALYLNFRQTNGKGRRDIF